MGYDGRFQAIYNMDTYHHDCVRRKEPANGRVSISNRNLFQICDRASKEGGGIVEGRIRTASTGFGRMARSFGTAPPCARTAHCRARLLNPRQRRAPDPGTGTRERSENILMFQNDPPTQLACKSICSRLAVIQASALSLRMKPPETYRPITPRGSQ